MRTFNRILVIQTAFIGDAVLTLPLIQTLKKFHPSAEIDVIAVPRSAFLFYNHPAVRNIIVYDKRGGDKGVGGFARLLTRIQSGAYDLAVVPHRSLRSALLAKLARIPVRVGFNRSSGSFLFSSRVTYRKEIHEIDRNLSLLEGMGIEFHGRELPNLFPSKDDARVVDAFLATRNVSGSDTMIAIAPGTIWNTKRWLRDRFAALASSLLVDGYHVVLIGGPEDKFLCEEIYRMVDSPNVVDSSGRLSLLQSAELLRRCRLLVSNDSAPMHLAVAMRTPVVAIFGATVPSFGFAPYGEHDVVVETFGLTCRPCSIHGGDECPIKTFVCMKNITPERVHDQVKKTLEYTQQVR